MREDFPFSIKPLGHHSGFDTRIEFSALQQKTLEVIEIAIRKLLKNADKVTVVKGGFASDELTDEIARIFSGFNVEIVSIDGDRIHSSESGVEGLDNVESIDSKISPGIVQGDIFLDFGIGNHLKGDYAQRKERRDMIIENLSDKGTLFVRNEFIADYNRDENTIFNLSMFYMNTICDAYQSACNKVDEQVKAEIMKRVKYLVCEGYGKGVVDSKDCGDICIKCLDTKREIESVGYDSKESGFWKRSLLQYVISKSNFASKRNLLEVEDRSGYYKTSVAEAVKELKPLKLKESYFVGKGSDTYEVIGLLEFRK